MPPDRKINGTKNKDILEKNIMEELIADMREIKNILYFDPKTGREGLVKTVDAGFKSISEKLDSLLAIKSEHEDHEERISTIEREIEKKKNIKVGQVTILSSIGALSIWLIEHAWGNIINIFKIAFK